MDDELTLAVAKILKDKQSDAGPSYTEIAERTSLSRPTVERILNGRRDINMRYLHELCAVLGLDPAQVVADAENAL
ncbi:helix-turn-helix transcriptional regulator [Microbacterium sp. KR10-403]|uniref:helix-turn-helix domain-containing protein n=1 Tax=Microbacterium sp. KR10-403 TaxID=3158581 RepID=UPI0032E487CB